MDYTYEGDIENVEGDWLVTFPQFDGTFGGGHTIDEACENAAEALRLRIASIVDEREPLPRSRFHNPPRVVFTVEVDDRYVRRTACMTVSEAAEMLGISRGRVSQLLNLGRLDAVVIDGKRMVTIASVNARLAEDVKAGRPKTQGL